MTRDFQVISSSGPNLHCGVLVFLRHVGAGPLRAARRRRGAAADWARATVRTRTRIRTVTVLVYRRVRPGHCDILTLGSPRRRRVGASSLRYVLFWMALHGPTFSVVCASSAVESWIDKLLSERKE